jgi:hypothetical protein
MRNDGLQGAVSFDKRHGYFGTASDLHKPVTAVSLNGLRRKVHAMMLPRLEQLIYNFWPELTRTIL